MAPVLLTLLPPIKKFGRKFVPRVRLVIGQQPKATGIPTQFGPYPKLPPTALSLTGALTLILPFPKFRMEQRVLIVILKPSAVRHRNLVLVVKLVP